MIPFKTFIIEGSYKLSDAERKGIDEITNRYMIYFGPEKLTGMLGRQKNPEKVYKRELNERGEFFLGSIAFTDLADEEKGEQNVYVDVSFEQSRSRADYLESDRKITLYYYTLGNESKSLIRSTILHEFLHAKQQYKKKGKEYVYATGKRTLPSGDVSMRSKRGYFLHPTEFPVHLSVIVDGIEQQYLNIVNKIDAAREQNNESEVKFWQRKKEGLLSFLKAYTTAGGRMSADVPLPPFLNDQYDFINTLIKNRNNPKYKHLYQSFLKTLTKVYDQIKSYEQR